MTMFPQVKLLYLPAKANQDMDLNLDITSWLRKIIQ